MFSQSFSYPYNTSFQIHPFPTPSPHHCLLFTPPPHSPVIAKKKTTPKSSTLRLGQKYPPPSKTVSFVFALLYFDFDSYSPPPSYPPSRSFSLSSWLRRTRVWCFFFFFYTQARFVLHARTFYLCRCVFMCVLYWSIRTKNPQTPLFPAPPLCQYCAAGKTSDDRRRRSKQQKKKRFGEGRGGGERTVQDEVAWG